MPNQSTGGSLIATWELPTRAFYRASSGADLKLHTVFQVWRRGSYPAYAKKLFPDYDVSRYVQIDARSDIKRLSPKRLKQLGDYDVFLAQTWAPNLVPKLVYRWQEVLYLSGHALKIKKDKPQVLKALNAVDWLEYSSKTAHGFTRIRQDHIKRALSEAGFGRIRP